MPHRAARGGSAPCLSRPPRHEARRSHLGTHVPAGQLLGQQRRGESGPLGLHRRVWSFISQPSHRSARERRPPDRGLHTVLPHGQEGAPGPCLISSRETKGSSSATIGRSVIAEPESQAVGSAARGGSVITEVPGCRLSTTSDNVGPAAGRCVPLRLTARARPCVPPASDGTRAPCVPPASDGTCAPAGRRTQQGVVCPAHPLPEGSPSLPQWLSVQN